MLGDHTLAFDLPAWFAELDHRAGDSCLVIRQGDHGAWLQAQTLQQAQGRGCRLPEHPRPLSWVNRRCALLAVQLRQTDTDEALIRGHYEGLQVWPSQRSTRHAMR
jgi:hypothetical protein